MLENNTETLEKQKLDNNSNKENIKRVRSYYILIKYKTLEKIQLKDIVDFLKVKLSLRKHFELSYLEGNYKPDINEYSFFIIFTGKSKPDFPNPSFTFDLKFYYQSKTIYIPLFFITGIKRNQVKNTLMEFSKMKKGEENYVWGDFSDFLK